MRRSMQLVQQAVGKRISARPIMAVPVAVRYGCAGRLGQTTRCMSSVEIERRVRKLMELERLGDTKVLQQALQRKRELQAPKAPYDVEQMIEGTI